MKRTVLAFVLLVCSGCAMALPAALEVPSALLSIGSTAVQLSYMDFDGKKIAVGWLPRHYEKKQGRLMIEAWELNYQFVKKTGWEGEELTWQEVLAAVGRKADNNATTLALVHKRPLPSLQTREIVVLHKTPTGRELQDPSEAPGEASYPFIKERSLTIPMYAYTVFFFAKSRQPSGILAAKAPTTPPCRPANGAGARVVAIGKNTPASRAYLAPGDIITKVNGRSVELQTLFSLFVPGENTLTLCRNGQNISRTVTMPGQKQSSQ